MRVAMVLIGMVLTIAVLIAGTALINEISKMNKIKLELEQCQQQVHMLEAERKYVKERIGVFYPKIKWEEK